MTPLAPALARLIEEHGPISIARYMALALGHPRHGYYRDRDPLGAGGDFVTAPEISQMFGELVGLALAQAWLDRGAPSPFLLVELGPGRGTLLEDALRATRRVPGFHAALGLHLVETGRELRARQAARLGAMAPVWHEHVGTLPDGLPLFLVANEFLDALPIRQFQRCATGWHERLVALDGEGGFAFALAAEPSPLGPALDRSYGPVALGELREPAPAREALASELAGRLARSGGVALLVDYGEVASRGDTFQAVCAHQRADPLTAPGEVDLSSHVDFGALARAATAAGARAWGPLPQGLWLQRLGIDQRAERLAAHAGPEVAEAVRSAHRRLVDPAAMGLLFRCLALTGDALPPPGFTQEEGAW